MRKIVYYVASSLDGYIAGPAEDISGFVGAGDGVDKYLADLADFDTVIMGRKTYEFGYKYGLEPGKTAYPHMRHYIFSNTLTFADPDPKIAVKPLDLAEVRAIRALPGTDIYLCGGGQFAGWLLAQRQIDQLKIKLNPLILGSGVPLFAAAKVSYQLRLIASEQYEHGLQLMTFDVIYD